MSSTASQYVTITLKGLAGLIRTATDPDIVRRAQNLHDLLMQRPLEEVLELVPGDTVSERAWRCGVSRQTFHAWMNGALPNTKQAIQLAKVTGFTVAEIRGSSATTAAAARAARVR